MLDEGGGGYERPFCARRERFWERTAELVQKLLPEAAEEATRQALDYGFRLTPELALQSPFLINYYLGHLDGGRSRLDVAALALETLREEGALILGFDREAMRPYFESFPICVLGNDGLGAIAGNLLSTLRCLGESLQTALSRGISTGNLVGALHSQLLAASLIVPWPEVEGALEEFPEAKRLADDFANGVYHV